MALTLEIKANKLLVLLTLDLFIPMKRFGVLLLLPLFISSCTQKGKVEKGVSFEMAQQRKSAITEIQYSLYFDIPASEKDSIVAKNTIFFTYSKKGAPYLYIDFNEKPEKIKKIVINQKPTNLIFDNEHIVIPVDKLEDGYNEIAIDFIAGDLSLNRNPDYLYTLFVPDRASTCFPSFDQPDLKASYYLELSVPPDWEAVSNQRAARVENNHGKKLFTFSLTKPISTYHFAFAAGKFKKATDEKSGMTMYYRETDSVKVAHNVGRIFDLHRQSLTWLEGYTNFRYPFIKFDFVLIPTFQYGGMEHPGSIFYKESSILLESTASVNQELRRASLIAHETAHMWFGNLVTMKWFNDVWLKEVFANFMAAKIVNPQFPEVNHELRFLMAHYPSAYEVDRSEGSHPVQQELHNLKNAGTLYGAIIYQKAPIMMRNLESLVGPENFRKGIQDYLNTYNYSNASWDDLIASLKKFTDKDLELWNTAWIKSKGMPTLAYTANETNEKINVTNDTAGIVWPQFFSYKFGEEVKDIVINDSTGALVTLEKPASNVVPNYKGRGYGYFTADEGSRLYMLNNVNNMEDPEVRAAIWMNIWEYVLRGELNAGQTLQQILSSLEKEKNPLVLEYLTNTLETLFWQFQTPADRQQISQQLDDKLFDLMALEKDLSLRRTLFNCYKKVASSETGVANLKKFWNDEITLGLDVSEQDHIQLAYELAIRGVEGYQEILATQLANIKNPDRRSQMEFIVPAVSNDEAARDTFFESLKNADNRAHEPWVLEALRYLHHPLRSVQSIKYIKPSLEMLEEVQLTGDIFFPKGWVDATVSTHQSKEAADIVREFLKENPQLSTNLKNKLLQSADMLFRAEKVIEGKKPQPM